MGYKRCEVFASYNIFQYLCDPIHVLIFVLVSKCQKSPKLMNKMMILEMLRRGLEFERLSIAHVLLVELKFFVGFVCRTEAMHRRLCFKRKFSDHFVFKLGCYLFLLFFGLV